jgi:hypothetical protein
MFRFHARIAFLVVGFVCTNELVAADATPPQYTAGKNGIASVEQALASKEDLWADEAMKLPGGPTYEFFKNLIPPLRYVEAPFRIYPIVLSAPGAAVKGRLLADGSQINALARQPNWHGEMGIPVTFRVGKQRVVFGSDPAKSEGPELADGYLPIVKLRFRDGENVYEEEAFADVADASAAHGVVMVRFTLVEGDAGRVEAQFEGSDIRKVKDGAYFSDPKQILATYNAPTWEFNLERNTFRANLKKGESATLAIYTTPGDQPIAINPGVYDEHRKLCADAWNKLLAKRMTIETPEAVVNDAARAVLIGSYELLTGDEIRYSAGNAYARLYIGEGCDATRSFMLWGHADDAAKMMQPLFVYTRKGLEFHQAAFKLQMLAAYMRLTRDPNWMNAHRDLWEKELKTILEGREKETGMLPAEKYAGDIETKVVSLNSNANCWRAIREMSVVFKELGQKDRAEQLDAVQKEYREAILKNVEKAIDRSTTPPFVPIALGGEEKPYDMIPSVRMGGYWNIMMNYVMGSGVFKCDSPTANDLLQYEQMHGGTMMGLLSTFGETNNYWQATRKVNDLYGMRYALLLQERDEADRALVSFYAKLAQGLTPGTSEACEGSDIQPLDERGRQMYLPPNSAGNANFLEQLRGLLVQDQDLDDDGVAETLRLCFDTPRGWLSDGKQIKVADSPTDFGPVSFTISSKLSEGVVDADVSLPERNPAASVLLRLRLPGGMKISGASAGGQELKVIDGETIDLSKLHGHVSVEAKVSK